MKDFEKALGELKKDYLEISPMAKFQARGWQDFCLKLALKDRRPRFFAAGWSRSTMVLIPSFILLAGGLFLMAKTTQASLPGEIFYPVKRASENLVTMVAGNEEIKTDNRAQEIVGLVKKNQGGTAILEKTVAEYRNSVAETKKEVEPLGKEHQEFDLKLEKHRDHFQEAIRENPSSEKELQRAISVTKDEEEHQGEEQD